MWDNSLLVVVALTLVLMQSSIADTEKWEVVRNKDGIKIEVAEVPGSNYKKFKATTTIESSVVDILAVLDDLKIVSDLVFDAKFHKLLFINSDEERYMYLVKDLPWPAVDRDMILRVLVDVNMEKNSARIIIKGLSEDDLTVAQKRGIPKDSSYHRVERVSGYIDLLAVSDNNTNIEYQLHVDPEGYLPSGVVNSLLVQRPYESVKALKRIAEMEK